MTTLIDREKTGCEHCGAEGHEAGCEHCGAEGHEASDTTACRDEALTRLASAHHALNIACTLLQKASAMLRKSHNLREDPTEEAVALADEVDKALGPG